MKTMSAQAILQEENTYDEKELTEICEKRSPLYRFFKRFFDVFLSVAVLICFSPFWLIIATAIWIEDKGPVLYVQERYGLNGKVFRMYKFRSMCRDAEKLHKNLLKRNELDGPAFKMKNDPRVTRVGRILRRTSLDEIPQLINIIKGEMSIVGPRPLVTYEAEQCDEYQNLRLLMKPGLTCYWQCSGRSNVTFDEWIGMDLRYIREAGFWVDLKIIFRTIMAVLHMDGAY